MAQKPEDPRRSSRITPSSFLLDLLRNRPTRLSQRPKALHAQRLAAWRFTILAVLIASGVLWLML